MTEITVNSELNVWRINIELPFGHDGHVQGYVEAVLTQGGAPVARTAPDPNVNISSTTAIQRIMTVTPEVEAAVNTLRDAVLAWLPEDVEREAANKAAMENAGQPEPEPEADKPAPAATGRNKKK